MLPILSKVIKAVSGKKTFLQYFPDKSLGQVAEKYRQMRTNWSYFVSIFGKPLMSLTVKFYSENYTEMKKTHRISLNFVFVCGGGGRFQLKYLFYGNMYSVSIFVCLFHQSLFALNINGLNESQISSSWRVEKVA